MQGREEKESFLMYKQTVILFRFPWPQPCLPLVLCRTPIIPDSILASHTAAYKIFTLAFQIYTLFTLDSIKYSNILLNIHNIYIALFCFVFPAASQGDCLELSQNHDEGSVSKGCLGWAHQGIKAMSPYNPGRCILGRSRTMKACLRENHCTPHSFRVFPTGLDWIGLS